MVDTILLCNFANGFGEKSGADDALAYYSHFTEKT